MNEADLKQVEALIRERVLALLGAMQDAANWYTSGYDDHTESSARVIWDVMGRTARELTPEPEPEPCKHTDTRNFGPRAGLRCVACNEPLSPAPVPASDPNPFAPVFPATDWAAGIATLIRQAQNDGHEVWVSGILAGERALMIGTGPDAPEAWTEIK